MNPSPGLTAARVAIVSGKGGVGKTTVSAAIAVAAARQGKKVLLAEIEDRHAFAPLFGVEQIGYAERVLEANLSSQSIEAGEALVEYLRLFYGIPKISRTLIQSKAVEFATHTAPGLQDILLIGKVKEAEQRRRGGAPVYDLIVLDAPPTGRLPRLLDAPRAIVDLVRSGPIRAQAQGVLDMLMDPARAQVVLVVQPEQMPVRETIEAVDTLRKMGLSIGPLVVNGMWPPIEKLGADAAKTLRSAIDDANIDLSDLAVEQLAIVASAQARRARNQRKAVKDLRAAIDLPRIELPTLFARQMDREQIDRLATLITASGAL